MTLIKRSFIYIRRNKKSNSILFALFMFITTFVLLGCNIMEFTGHIAENLREKIGGIIYIYPNTVDMEDMGESKLVLSSQMIQEISENKQIGSVNLQKKGEVSSKDIEFIHGQNASENINAGFAYGDTHSELNDYFTREIFKLEEGRHISPEDKFAIIISDELAKYNGYSVGDTVSIAPAELAMIDSEYVNLLQDTEEQVIATIVGIYTILEKQGGGELQPTVGRWENLLFTTHTLLEQLNMALPEEYSAATIFVKDPAMTDDIIKYVRKQSGFGKNECIIQKNTTGYERVEDNILFVRKIVNALLSGIVVVGIIVLLLFMKFSYKGRIKEFGILMSLGKSKAELSLQLFLELMIVFLMAYLVAAGAAAIMSQEIIQELEKKVFEGISCIGVPVWKIYVITLLRILVVELLLMMASSLGFKLSILRFRPQQILTKLE